VRYTPSGNLLTAALDNKVKLWTPALAPIRTFAARTNEGVMSAAVDPAETIVVSGNQDGTLDVWELATGRPLRHLTAHSARIWQLVFAPDGRTLYSGSDDGTVAVWDVATWTVRTTLDPEEGGVVSVALSPDAGTLATGHRSSGIVLWDLARRAPRLRIGGRARDHGSCNDVTAQAWVDDAHRAVVAAACSAPPAEYLARIARHSHLEMRGKVDVIESW
jgi:WD40 repeat protein